MGVVTFSGEGNAFILETPAPLVILFAFGGTAGDQKDGVGNQDDSPSFYASADPESQAPATPGNGP